MLAHIQSANQSRVILMLLVVILILALVVELEVALLIQALVVDPVVDLAVAPRPLWRLPPPAFVASPLVFTAPGSGSPSPVEVAPAGLCRVVASVFSAPGSGSPSPVEVAPAGLRRVVASVFSAPGSDSPASGSFFRPGWLRYSWIWRLRVFSLQLLTSIHLTRYSICTKTTNI